MQRINFQKYNNGGKPNNNQLNKRTPKVLIVRLD